jgi:hypothetical protein
MPSSEVRTNDPQDPKLTPVHPDARLLSQAEVSCMAGVVKLPPVCPGFGHAEYIEECENCDQEPLTCGRDPVECREQRLTDQYEGERDCYD